MDLFKYTKLSWQSVAGSFILSLGLTSSSAYSYSLKSGHFKSSVNYKGQNLKVSWGAYQPSKKNSGMLVYFHGDGGGGGYLNSLKSLKKVADDYGLHAVAVKAPVSHSWQGPIDTNNQKHPYPNAQAFDEFLFDYISRYSVDRNKVFFSGVSGGAMYISGHYIPKYGRNIKGGMILLCGGATSAEYIDQKNAAFYNSKGFSKGFSVYQYISKDDHLFMYAEDAKKDYSALGHPYKTVWPASGGHCGFPIFKTMKEGLSWMIK